MQKIKHFLEIQFCPGSIHYLVSVVGVGVGVLITIFLLDH